MAISINSISTLQNYLNGVLERTGYHTENVEKISLSLLDTIMCKLDGEFKVEEYKDKPVNMIWFWVNENRYALNYSYSTEPIELKERSHKGAIIISFDNIFKLQSNYKNI